MSNNPYLYEKLVATRHAEIRHNMELSRKPVHVEHSSTFVEHAAVKLGTVLVELGSRLQRAERQHGASLS